MSELGNEAWEFLFGELKGDVPEVLTDDVLNRLAAAIVTALEAASSTPDGEVVVDGKNSPEVKAICDTLDFLRRGEHEPYWLDARDGIALMRPLLKAATKLDKLERRAHPAPIKDGVTLAREDVPVDVKLAAVKAYISVAKSCQPAAMVAALQAALALYAAHITPISKGVTVKALEWGVRRVIDGVNWAWDAKTAIDWYVVATASGEGCRGSHYWFVSGDTIKGWANSEAEAKALCEADFDARVRSCLPHNAGEIEAGGDHIAGKMVEQAFRDGIAYASLCEVTDVDLAWSQSRARAALEPRL